MTWRTLGVERLRLWQSDVGDEITPIPEAEARRVPESLGMQRTIFRGGGCYGGMILKQEAIGHLCCLSFLLGLPSYIFQIYSTLCPSFPLLFSFLFFLLPFPHACGLIGEMGELIRNYSTVQEVQCWR